MRVCLNISQILNRVVHNIVLLHDYINMAILDVTIRNKIDKSIYLE